MKKLIAALLTAAVLCTGAPALAQEIKGQQIGKLYAVTEADGQYLADSEGKVIAGPFAELSDQSGYAYAYTYGDDKIMFDLDGSVLAEVDGSGEILAPCNGIYAIMPDTTDMSLCTVFDVYDYETKTLIHSFDGAIMYYLEMQADKMFIEKGGKYAIVDKYGNFYTDYIYDGVKKRFNPSYDPFPLSYAVVIQNGEEKYIDWELNEIDLDDYNGEPFITNCWRIRSSIQGEEYYKEYYVLESGSKQGVYDMETGEYILPLSAEYTYSAMDGSYITAVRDEKYGLLDHSGNTAADFIYSSLENKGDGKYYYTLINDDDSVSDGYIYPASGDTAVSELEARDHFYKAAGGHKKEDVIGATIVYGDRCADLAQEDIDMITDRFWDFSYERVIEPQNGEDKGEYILLRFNDGTVCAIYSDCGIIVGSYGKQYNSGGTLKQNYVWYKPYIGNARNGLLSAFEGISSAYRDNTRNITVNDSPGAPEKDMLKTDGCSSWAYAEIERAAAENLMIPELEGKYTDEITRQEFCDLAVRLAATQKRPASDSRVGINAAKNDMLSENEELMSAYNSISYNDCASENVRFLSALGVINGTGDGNFEPDRSIKREEAAAILYRLQSVYKTPAQPDHSTAYSDDPAISDWAEEAVYSVRESGIMTGMDENEFAPAGAYTVEQAVATMLRLYDDINS